MDFKTNFICVDEEFKLIKTLKSMNSVVNDTVFNNFIFLFKFKNKFPQIKYIFF